jgi:C-terminal processing protease CtpA/Prc
MRFIDFPLVRALSIACVLFSAAAADAQTFWKKKITPLDARAGAATQVMVHLAEDAWAPTTYRQLFEWCAGTQAPAELVAAPNDKSKGLWAIENEANRVAPSPAELDAWSQQCITRMAKGLSPRNKTYTKSELDRFDKGEMFGLGLVLTQFGEDWLVREAQPGSSAAASGIKPGDVLVSINRQPLRGLGPSEVWGKLMASSESSYELAWHAYGQGTNLSTAMVSAVLKQPVRSAFVENMGSHLYIRVPMFSRTAPSEIMSGLRKTDGGPDMVKVLDLRGNPGGAMQAILWTIAMLGQTEGHPQWSPQRLRNSPFPRSEFDKHDVLRYPPAPLDSVASPSKGELSRWPQAKRWLVLVDRDTHSGAAWLAAVLRELNGALLVGVPTQSDAGVISLSWRLRTGMFQAAPRDETVHGIQFEAGRLALPSGALMESSGVLPDIVVNQGIAAVRPYPASAEEWKVDPMYGEVVNTVVPGVPSASAERLVPSR